MISLWGSFTRAESPGSSSMSNRNSCPSTRFTCPPSQAKKGHKAAEGGRGAIFSCPELEVDITTRTADNGAATAVCGTTRHHDKGAATYATAYPPPRDTHPTLLENHPDGYTLYMWRNRNSYIRTLGFLLPNLTPASIVYYCPTSSSKRPPFLLKTNLATTAVLRGGRHQKAHRPCSTVKKSHFKFK